MGWIKTGSEALDIRNDLVALHEPLGITAVIRKFGKVAEPIRRNQTERIPSLTPSVADPPAIEDYVFHATMLQVPAGRKSGLTPTNNYGVDVLAQSAPLGSFLGQECLTELAAVVGARLLWARNSTVVTYTPKSALMDKNYALGGRKSIEAECPLWVNSGRNQVS